MECFRQELVAFNREGIISLRWLLVVNNRIPDDDERGVGIREMEIEIGSIRWYASISLALN